MAAAATEAVKGNPRESTEMLWSLYEYFREQNIRHILDPRVNKDETVLFLGLVTG